MDEVALTAGDLLTMAGGSTVALIFAQFFKKLLNLQPAAVRSVAMLVGLLTVVTATVLSLDETSVLEILLATVVGMQAGLAASALVDSVKDGLSYETVRTNGGNHEEGH